MDIPYISPGGGGTAFGVEEGRWLLPLDEENGRQNSARMERVLRVDVPFCLPDILYFLDYLRAFTCGFCLADAGLLLCLAAEPSSVLSILLLSVLVARHLRAEEAYPGVAAVLWLPRTPLWRNTFVVSVLVARTC